MRFYFDFDDTLADGWTPDTKWKTNAVESLKALLRAGHEVRIWSARGDEEFGGTKSDPFMEMLAMVRTEFPEMAVEAKPYAHHYVDDRAIPVGGAPGAVSLDWIASTYGADG